MTRSKLPPALLAVGLMLPLGGCITVDTPDKPIEINLNVTIRQEVLVRLQRDVETLINIPTTMLIGIGVVIFAFNLAIPISQLSSALASGTLGIALACVPCSSDRRAARSASPAAIARAIAACSSQSDARCGAACSTAPMARRRWRQCWSAVCAIKGLPEAA